MRSGEVFLLLWSGTISVERARIEQTDTLPQDSGPQHQQLLVVRGHDRGELAKRSGLQVRGPVDTTQGFLHLYPRRPWRLQQHRRYEKNVEVIGTLSERDAVSNVFLSDKKSSPEACDIAFGFSGRATPNHSGILKWRSSFQVDGRKRSRSSRLHFTQRVPRQVVGQEAANNELRACEFPLPVAGSAASIRFVVFGGRGTLYVDAPRSHPRAWLRALFEEPMRRKRRTHKRTSVMQLF